MSAEFHDPLNSSETNTVTGIVLAIQANYYQVQLDQEATGNGWGSDVKESEGAETEGLRYRSVKNLLPGIHGSQAKDFSLDMLHASSHTLLCTRRSRLKKLGQKVMVGDRVEIEEPDWLGGRGAIAHVFPRMSELDRPPVANANQILLVFALAEPDLDPYQLSRFLVKAESTGLEVGLCLNKRDLVSNQTQEDWQQRLEQWGYCPVLVSVYKELGLNKLQTRLSQNVTVVSGPSGVGKSTLINWLIPQANLRTGAVSGKLAKGRHTTRHVELFELPGGGLLADTPGFNQPELDCAPENLAHYFPEVRHQLASNRCQFSDCLHRDEPNCAVRGDWERYEHYLSFLEEAIAQQEKLNRLGDEESNLKLKTKSEGRQAYEPKLETKKYRRSSRRAQQQKLQALGQDFEEADLDTQ